MNRFTSAVCFLSCCIVFSGCQPTPTEVGVSKVPIYPGSVLIERDSMGAQVGDSLNNLKPITTTSWSFEVTASMKEIEDFYRSKYPNAEFELDQAEMTIEEARASGEFEPDELVGEDFSDYLTVFIPTDNPKIDELTIGIREGAFEIAESVND